MRRIACRGLIAGRCSLLVAGAARCTRRRSEKPKLTIGVGGKTLFYYLPLTIAERKGYFKDEGLDVEILDFPGGAQALQALVGGSVDIVSGAYEHTITQQAKGQNIEALVLQGKYAGIVLGMTKEKAAAYKSPADLKGMKIGVTAPGSSTNMFVNILLAKDGLKPDDVVDHRRRRDRRRGRDHEARRDRRDLEPRSGDLAARGRRHDRAGRSTRAPRRACRRSTAAPTRPAASTCRSTSRRRTRTPCRRSSTRWCARCASSRQSTPDQIVAAVPPEYYADKALYKAALEKNLDELQARRLDQRSRPAQNVYARPEDLRSRPCRTRPSTSRRPST